MKIIGLDTHREPMGDDGLLFKEDKEPSVIVDMTQEEYNLCVYFLEKEKRRTKNETN